LPLVVQAPLHGVAIRFTDLLLNVLLTAETVREVLDEAREVAEDFSLEVLTGYMELAVGSTTALWVEELVTEQPDLVAVLVQMVVTLEKVGLLEDIVAETQVVPQVKPDLLITGQTNPMQNSKSEEIKTDM
jgi:hypothetical protein